MKHQKVLVTGATGFLGRRTVEMLLERGFQVRALVRTPTKAGSLAHLGVEIAHGDVADSESMKSAFEDVDYIIHAAADTSGTKEGACRVTIGGTKNILDLCSSHQIKKLVHISSCSVYCPADYKDREVIDENASLERFPERRGIYSWAKYEAEKIVLDYMKQKMVSAVCIRPGTIYGPGGENYSPMMGFAFKNKIFIVIRNNKFLNLVYIDDLVQAIIAGMVQDKSTGHIYNVVDTYQVGKKEYINGFIRNLYPGAWIVYMPYSILSAAVGLQEMAFKTLGRNPFLTKYRLISSQRPIIYSSSKIKSHLDWQPSFSFGQAVEMIVAHKKAKKEK